ncbi:MAG: DUF4138 domain-containing protein [Pedobacter sp.]|nr:MAG: DUF4138 domain-containing protein [Pedobacter sp.]
MGHLSISGSKMSKSLKNFTTIREALARGDWNARSLRIIFLLGGWHDGIEITDDMRKGGSSWESYVTNFFYKVRDLEVHPNISSTGAEDEKVRKSFEATKKKVHNALADSFDTPSAMRAISGLITDYNSADKPGLSDGVSFDVARYITRMVRIFGLDGSADPYDGGIGWAGIDIPAVAKEFVYAVSRERDEVRQHAIAGDLPLNNVLRLKILPDSAAQFKGAGIVTIFGESFIAQYNLRYTEGQSFAIPSKINILPEHSRPLDVPGISLTSREMQDFAMRILQEPAGSTLRKAKAFGLQAKLNHVYTAGDHIFLDITYYNQSNLAYQIDEQRFKIEDKKITKATNVQSVEIKPVWQLYKNSAFKKHYRNVYVLKKVTFPGNKVLNIELTEKQISGRVLTLQMKYKDILNADNL